MTRRMQQTACWIGAALLLAACDISGDNDGGGNDGGNVSTQKTQCLEDLGGFDAAPICTADAGAEGGDVICYVIDGGDTTTVVETADEVSANYFTPNEGDAYTTAGLTSNSGPAEDTDGILLNIELDGTGEGEVGRYSSWSGPDSAHYRAVGEESGCGMAEITESGNVGGRIVGEFEGTFCAYNGDAHVIDCDLEVNDNYGTEINIQGAFDITRGAGTASSGTPFLTHPEAAAHSPK